MPLYETDEDRATQLRIAQAYASPRSLSVVMTSRAALLPWDAEFSRQRLLSIAEIKRRTNTRGRYRTFKIDQAKLDDMIVEANRRHVRCGVLVEFVDGLFKVEISEAWLLTYAEHAVIHRKDRPGETPDPAWEWPSDLWQSV